VKIRIDFMGRFIEKTGSGWLLKGGGLEIAISAASGAVDALRIVKDAAAVDWTPATGSVKVRDDLLRKEFDERDLERVSVSADDDSLTLEKHYSEAPWVLRETWSLDDGVPRWSADISLASGDFRSVAVTLHIPWPQPLYPVKLWAAREGMPSAPHMFAEIAWEYGEITSGILFPTICAYLEKEDIGLQLFKPLDFKTPRLRFISGYREPDLRCRFDWLALSPGKPAKTELLLRGTGGAWRPALKWIYEKYPEYFEPRSKNIWNLFGGHVSGKSHVSDAELATMMELGLKWYELHGHFPAYGNYHPEKLDSWRSGHHRTDETILSVASIRETIGKLKKAGVAVLPYIQLSGDGDTELLRKDILDCGIRDFYGKTQSAWPGTELLNSDSSLPFGKDLTRQIDGMADRYPEADGVFVDQAGYNFVDHSHDDGISAIDNKPVYMTGFNYQTHLERLSERFHSRGGCLIANAPLWIESMKYFDAFMAEGTDWLCDHFQYYSLAKPMFFLMYEKSDRDIELMFRRSLLYGAGYASYPEAVGAKKKYEAYAPLLELFRGRKWCFAPKPIETPTGYQAGAFISKDGGMVCGIVPDFVDENGTPSDREFRLDISELRCKPTEFKLHAPGCASEPLSVVEDDATVRFSIPRDMPVVVTAH
jgi:hypothetical protein